MSVENIEVKGFAETLNRLLKERGLSAKEVSRSTGIPTSTLSEWGSGRSPKLSPELLKLARFLGVSLEYLVTGKDVEKDIVDDLLKEDNEEFVTVHRGVYRIRVEKLRVKIRDE